jgi:probable rRNA maturation factor
MRINFYNNSNENIWKYQRLIKRLFKPINRKDSFNLIFVTEEEIQEINRTYRNIDKVTDVISFAQIDEENRTDYRSLGDIFICVKRAFDQAKEYNHSSDREFAFLAVHGYLHLCGFDHMTKEDEEVMFKIQDDILLKAGINR